jgi:hypothetical protein
MSLNVGADIEAGLQAIAQAHGVSVEAYLQDLVRKELAGAGADQAATKQPPRLASGMVREGGLFIYRTGNPLPASVVDEAVRRSREDRAARVLGVHDSGN